MGYFFYVAMVLSITIASGYELNEKTCDRVENPITFDVYKLICFYKGPGLYELTGPKSLRVVEMDRLTAQSHLRVEVELQEINIKEGQCKYITAPTTVMVFVGGKQCIASTTMETTSASRAPSTASTTMETTSESRAPSTASTTMETTSESRAPSTKSQPHFKTTSHQSTTTSTTENTPTDNQFSTLQTSSASGQDSSNDEKTTPWIVSTIVAITEYIKHCVVAITILVISCRQIMTFIENARNAQPPLLMVAPAPLQLHQIPGPQPIPPQQPLAQQHPLANQQPARPLRRGQRVRRAPKRLTY